MTARVFRICELSSTRRILIRVLWFCGPRITEPPGLSAGLRPKKTPATAVAASEALDPEWHRARRTRRWSGCESPPGSVGLIAQEPGEIRGGRMRNETYS